MAMRGSRGDLVISMTLAETFLLLIFMVWYSVRPRMPVDPPTTAEVLKKENRDLKLQIDRLKTELVDIQARLEWWRKRFDQPVPGSEEELKKVLLDAGRGKPKCQDENVLLEISLINGTATAKVLVDSPALRLILLPQHIDFHAGAILARASEIDALLREVRAYRKGPGLDGDCRFDYHFRYATFEDYYVGRERFEKYFYSAGAKHIDQEPQR